MADNTQKVCPILANGFLSYRGRDEAQDTQDVMCLEDQCGWYDEERKQCSLITLTKTIEKT